MASCLAQRVVETHEFASITAPAADPGGWEGWAAVVVGAVAAFFAYLQLRSLEKSARAEVIFRLDSDFESGAVLDSRQRIQTLKNATIAQAKRERTQVTGALELSTQEEIDTWVDARARAIFSEALDRLLAQYLISDFETLVMGDKDGSAELYGAFMRLPYWLETTAALNRQALVTRRDILRFYDFVFDDMWSWFQGHIINRRSRGNDLFCRNFEDMAYQAKFHLAQSQRPLISRTKHGLVHTFNRTRRRMTTWLVR